MRLVFAGTPEFAAVALAALHDAGHDIALVLTQPDRPAGRGMKPRPSPVKTLAIERALPVYQPGDLKSEAARQPIADAGGEVMVVAAYGLILPQAVLDLPRLGCVNIHASLLPRWRGAAPIQRAILAGDRETGITLMQMESGLDTGPILAMARLPIGAQETAGSLHDRLAALGAREIVALLPRLAAGEVIAQPQDDRHAVYAAKIDKQAAHIDWQQPAVQIERQVRAFNPHPGAWTVLGDTVLKVWQARCLSVERLTCRPQPSPFHPLGVASGRRCGVSVERLTCRPQPSPFHPLGVASGRRYGVNVKVAQRLSTLPSPNGRGVGGEGRTWLSNFGVPHKAMSVNGQGRPGEVLAATKTGIVVACGEGALSLLELQQAGGRRLDAAAYLSGHGLAPGVVLGEQAKAG